MKMKLKDNPRIKKILNWISNLSNKNSSLIKLTGSSNDAKLLANTLAKHDINKEYILIKADRVKIVIYNKNNLESLVKSVDKNSHYTLLINDEVV